MNVADIAISVRQVGKRYKVFDSQRDRLLHSLWPRHTRGMEEVWALRDINLEILRGESFAIIGRNGGGKSTLLEIITGTLQPTEGEVHVNGRVAALLELGSGFNPDYTGHENIFLNGMLLGLSRSSIESRYDDIVGFADIGDVLDRPVKTYSSGMLVRLAFAVQVALEPEVLIVDEALSVGDYFFQQKCFSRLRQMRDRGLTLLFVSHDMGTVRDLCQRALLLQRGRAVCVGEALPVIRRYFADGTPEPAAKAPATITPSASLQLPHFGPEVAWARQIQSEPKDRLLAVRLLGADGNDTTAVGMGQILRVRVYCRDCSDLAGARIALTLKNRQDQIVTVRHSDQLGVERIEASGSPCVVIDFELDVVLEAGLYSLRVVLGRRTLPNRGNEIDATPWLGPVHVQWDYEQVEAPFLGMFGVPSRARLASLNDQS